LRENVFRFKWFNLIQLLLIERFNFVERIKFVLDIYLFILKRDKFNVGRKKKKQNCKCK